MSISGLSNHLCIVVATIISVHVVSWTFQRVCAATDSHEFFESRQFQRNLAVSKYRNNTYWLPNYTWKPPEKFHGTRKRPAWEVEEVTESPADKKEREEREEWEKKMREVTRHEIEKWNNEETKNESVVPVIEGLDDTTKIVESENSLETTKNQPDGSLILTNDLENSRWGMTVQKSVADRYFNDSPKTSDPITINRMHQETMKNATFPNGRWGIGVKEPPKEFLKEMSRMSPSGVRSQDEDRTPVGNGKIHDDAKDGEETKNIATRRASKKLTIEFPNSRWGMSRDSSPRDFLRKISGHGNQRISKFYNGRTSHQAVISTIGKNNYLSRELTLLKIPRILDLDILQSFPGVDERKIKVSIFPGYILNPRKLRTSTKYNYPMIRCMICHS